LKQKLGRVFKFGRTGTHHPDAASPDESLRRSAAEELEAYARAHPAPFERAERLREKVERTGSDGTPSESARLRAARAREEALMALASVRAAFVGRHGAGAGGVFDLEFDARYPAVLAGSGQDVIEP
jgi:hypothetical protein